MPLPFELNQYSVITYYLTKFRKEAEEEKREAEVPDIDPVDKSPKVPNNRPA